MTSWGQFLKSKNKYVWAKGSEGVECVKYKMKWSCDGDMICIVWFGMMIVAQELDVDRSGMVPTWWWDSMWTWLSVTYAILPHTNGHGHSVPQFIYLYFNWGTKKKKKERKINIDPPVRQTGQKAWIDMEVAARMRRRPTAMIQYTLELERLSVWQSRSTPIIGFQVR